MLDPRLKKRVIQEGLEPYLSREVETWEMDAAGQYTRRKGRRGGRGHAQTLLLEMLAAKRGA